MDLPGSPRHGQEAASAWVQRWSHLVADDGCVLDVACGHGRHTRWFLDRGQRVVAVDRSAEAIASLSESSGRCELVLADIENGPWPLAGRSFDAVIVTNYLWRALLPTLLASLAPGGVLIYETFASGNETVGKRSRPDFLLAPGELIQICQGLRIIAFEDGFAGQPASPQTARSERFVQRIAAIREGPTALASSPVPPARYRID